MRPSPFHPHPCPEKALLPGGIVYPSMVHTVELPYERYREVLLFGLAIIEDAFGIRHGDTIHFVCNPYLGSWDTGGRSFFAYAKRFLCQDGVKDGYVLLLLGEIGPHEPKPWYTKHSLEFPLLSEAHDGNA